MRTDRNRPQNVRGGDNQMPQGGCRLIPPARNLDEGYKFLIDPGDFQNILSAARCTPGNVVASVFLDPADEAIFLTAQAFKHKR
jgi:hypothetical protein